MKFTLEDVKALGELFWFQPLEDCDLEIGIVPAEAATLGLLEGNVDPDVEARRVCHRAFKEFRNFNDKDGKPVPNTLENRIWLYKVQSVRIAIRARLNEQNNRVLVGEESAASV